MHGLVGLLDRINGILEPAVKADRHVFKGLDISVWEITQGELLLAKGIIDYIGGRKL